MDIGTFWLYISSVQTKQRKVGTESLLLCYWTQIFFLLQNFNTQCLALVQIFCIEIIVYKKCLTRCVYFLNRKGKVTCTRDVWKKRLYALRCFLIQYTLYIFVKMLFEKKISLWIFFVKILIMYPVVFILCTVIYLHPKIWRLCFSWESSLKAKMIFLAMKGYSLFLFLKCIEKLPSWKHRLSLSFCLILVFTIVLEVLWNLFERVSERVHISHLSGVRFFTLLPELNGLCSWFSVFYCLTTSLSRTEHILWPLFPSARKNKNK